MRLRLPDSRRMRLTAAARSSYDALDQWGIQFPLVSEDPAGLLQPSRSSVSRGISSWRLSNLTLPPRHGDALDQWGIEFPITYDELAAFGANCRGRSQPRTWAILGGRAHAIGRVGACAAVLAVAVAGSASAVPSSVLVGAQPSRNGPVLILAAGSAQPAPLPSIAVQPTANSNQTSDPTPGPISPAKALGIDPVSYIPDAAVLPLQVESVALPTIQDARDYLVARLGTRVDRYFGLSQSQCASRIFEYEARWDPHATNRSSGAYGLPQANPASKLAGWAEARAEAAAKAGDPEAAWLYRAWRDNAVVQAEWGVDYMTTRYGSPCAALAFRNEAGWY
jgi:hypothetical protein